MFKLSLILFFAMQVTGTLSFAGDKERGKLISQSCTGCHGANGIPAQPMHPNLAGQKERYLSWQLKAFRSGDRPSHIMNDMARDLTDQDIDDLASYYSSINTCE